MPVIVIVVVWLFFLLPAVPLALTWQGLCSSTEAILPRRKKFMLWSTHVITSVILVCALAELLLRDITKHNLGVQHPMVGLGFLGALIVAGLLAVLSRAKYSYLAVIAAGFVLIDWCLLLAIGSVA